jgi:signal-transduction protein with cAMP-binding, CBS, and nucleotidyltransferase domain
MLDVRVGDIAKKKLITIEEGASVASATKMMTELNVGSIVITKDKQPVGIVTERDLVRKILAEGRDPASTTVGQIMTLHPISIDEDRTLHEAIDLMGRKKIRRMLVTKNGEMTGIFTQRDILGLSRICLYCGKEIKSMVEYGKNADRYVECECGSRYHMHCAHNVVHCLDCSRTVVANVVYSDPADTMSG